ncbi:ADP-ribosylglycohydrolase family protein [Lysobacter korlensis]|uniref:ADP-ribosylglycohydrolase family protein n=1 Tax=Lysobacter korlensis TaxID=553636 RepID=A0ABV6RVD8_9GAMM
MHDVLDPRDLVPDEAEELELSGFAIGDLHRAARDAAGRDDFEALEGIGRRLAQAERRADWPYDEPSDDATLRALAAGVAPIEVDPAGLPDRIRGAWLGRAVGNTLGKPVEGLTRDELRAYFRAAGVERLQGYLPLIDPLPDGVSRLHPSAPIATAGNFSDVPRDDDIDWTIVGLHVLEKHGRDFTTEQLAAEWLDRVPFTQTYTAERAAYRNLIHGIRPPATATHRNPYREWIGALIRGDVFGYVNPGNPGAAAAMALKDARLSHTGNGIYGELWAAALVSAALAADSAKGALAAAAHVVPPRSRLAEVLAQVTELHAGGASVEQALDWVDERLAQYSWVHTLNNAALIAIGLLWGVDYLDAVGITISGGRDTDSAGATVGSAYGALHGAGSIPAELVGTTHVHVRSAVRDFDRVTLDELSRRTLSLLPAASR